MERKNECRRIAAIAACLLLLGTAGCATSPSEVAEVADEAAASAETPVAQAPPQVLPRPRPHRPVVAVEMRALPVLSPEMRDAIPHVIPRPRDEPQKDAAATPARLDAPPPSGLAKAQGFEWPVEGRIIASFGSGQDGQRNDGINIAADAGTPIHATAAGIVTYADRLKGYGNLVLIKHDNGYISAYAHAQSLIVSQGDRVDRGDVIGFAGKSGDVATPQLHFEIRKGVKPVNPKLLLAASTES